VFAVAEGRYTSMSDNSSESPDKSIEKRIRDKETQVLAELTATVNTLSNLHAVLDDIVALTDPGESPHGQQNSQRQKNVAVKQKKLLEELQQWQSLSSGDTTESY